MRRNASLAALLALAGCEVGPNYAKPQIVTPVQFAEAAPQPQQLAVDLARWWQAFGDPELDRLVTLALAQNLDIKESMSRVRQARAGIVAARAQLLPTVDAMGDATRIHFSKNAGLTSLQSLFGGGQGSGGSSSGGSHGGIAAPGGNVTTYSAGFDARWELDLFGGGRRGVESAVARTEAAEWQARDTAISLAAEVASDYLMLRTLQNREAVLRAEIARQDRALQLMVHTVEAGLAPQGDYIRQRSGLAATQAQLDPILADQRIQMHALALLLGQSPDMLIAELTAASATAAPPDVPPGLPSDLLRRRPDVRAAERNLAAATADIGVAVADLYPKITLTDITQLISTALASLFETDSVQAAVSAQAMFPVLDFGRRRAQVHIREEQREQAYLDYQRTVLGALKDVEDALVRIRTERERNATLRAGLTDADRSLAAVQARYNVGLIDLSPVLQEQQTELSARDTLADSDGQLRQDLASLYKALGGGWDESAPLVVNPLPPEAIRGKRPLLGSRRGSGGE